MSEQDTQVQDATSSEQEVAEETTEGTEETQETQAEEAQEEVVPKAQFNQAIARAKKAEAENKALKAAKAPVQKSEKPVTNAVTQDQIDISILKSQGMSSELISELQTLAKVRGKSLIDTQNDPIFLAMKSQKEAEAKAQKAKLGAAKGSGSAKTVKGFDSQGLTPAEHKALWKERNGQ